MDGETMRAVRFERYGGVEELQVVDVPWPAAEPGRAVVDVVAASINPGEAAIRRGVLHDRFPAQFPEGEGSDLAGVVAQVGAGVTNVAVGDEVIGWSDERSSHAEAVSVPATQLVPKPEGVSWEAAGSLYVAGVTAVANVRSVRVQDGDVVAVSAAAGGVGSITVQLARHRGANVIGIAGPRSAEWLRSVGVVPVEYGDGLAERIGAAAPTGVDAFIDCFGGGYVDLAVELGVPRDRINTIIDWPAAQRLGTKQDGMATVADPAAAISELAELIARGDLVVPIARTFPLDDVRLAYEQLEQRHTLGQIVLLMRRPPA
ncbi:MAG TPA: NADP-dependent oxidoreductase [Acidimicrobiales bacterium]|nr:NADP-dependent oxidoreductase [Acidimicrobiales bacterium]